MRILKWFVARLGSRRAAHAVRVIALVLALPSLFSPLWTDEYIQVAKWKASVGGSFLNDCFVFSSGDSAANLQRMERGGAWWTAPDWKIAFWRPLSAATHAIDLSLWPGNVALMHLHTLLWFLGLLWALSALYRRFLTPGVASLALALYAWGRTDCPARSRAEPRGPLLAHRRRTLPDTHLCRVSRGPRPDLRRVRRGTRARDGVHERGE